MSFKQMPNGHKGELFVLCLSFIGWNLAGCNTFGIAYIWITPYMQATYTNVYKSLKPPVASAPAAEVIAE